MAAGTRDSHPKRRAFQASLASIVISTAMSALRVADWRQCDPDEKWGNGEIPDSALERAGVAFP